MTEEEFYQLKPGDLVEYNGDEFEYSHHAILINPYYDVYVFKKKNRGIQDDFHIYQVSYRISSSGFKNNYAVDDDNTLGNLKLIKKISTIDEKISETKSEIEKLQNQLKELESEKNSKKIEQLISEMVPGKFYTIKYSNYSNFYVYKTGKVFGFSRDFINVIIESHGIQIPIKSIKDIIPREDLTNDYNKFMEKIKKYNQGEI